MGFPTAGYGSGFEQGGTSEIDFALKNFYLPGMEEQKNNARFLLANLERNEKDVSGEYAYVPVLLGRNWGIGMRSNRQPLPDPGYQRGAKAQIPMRYAFGRLTVTLHAMAATRQSQGSYDTVLDVETEGLMEDLPKDINRQLFLDGTGRIGTLSADPGTGTTWTLDNAGLGHTNSNEYTKYIESGMRFDVLDSGGSVRAGSPYTVDSVTSASVFESTAAADATVADNDWISIDGNYNIEVTGLDAMVATTGTYQNINRATAGNERWQSNVVDGSGDIAESDMQQLWTAIQKASGMEPTAIVSTYEFRDQYASLLAANQRFVNTITYEGGYKGPEFHGVGIIPDTECPRGRTYFLNMPYINLYQHAGLQYMDDDGNILDRVSGYAAYEATLYWFFEMGTRRCNVHGKLTNFNQ